MTTGPETPIARTAAWGADSRATRSVDLSLAVPMAVALAIFVVGIVLDAPVVGVVAGVAVVVGASLWRTSSGARALKAVGAQPLPPESNPRLWNMVRGLASDLSVPVPRTHLVAGEGPNAFVVGGRQPHLGFTQALLDGYTRTELEATVAHCLARIAAASHGRIGSLTFADDIAAAAVTLYPPSLASALGKAVPFPDRPGVHWFVPSDAALSAEARALEVLDL